MIKKITFIASLAILSLTSCASFNAPTINNNNQSTQVVLSKNNFKVIDSVTGESETTYILGIGGISKKSLVAEARKNMIEKANLIGSAKAIINEKIEVKSSVFPFVGKVQVMVSAEVIEFTN